MKRTLILLPLALLVFGVLAQAEVVQNENQNQTTTTTIVLSNPCINENINFTLTQHYVSKVIVNGNTIDGRTHINTVGTGVGETSGAHYMVNSTDNLALQFAVEPYQTNQTFFQHMNAIGEGGVANFKLHMRLHLQIGANGRVTAFVDNFAETCQ